MSSFEEQMQKLAEAVAGAHHAPTLTNPNTFLQPDDMVLNIPGPAPRRGPGMAPSISGDAVFGYTQIAQQQGPGPRAPAPSSRLVQGVPTPVQGVPAPVPGPVPGPVYTRKIDHPDAQCAMPRILQSDPLAQNGTMVSTSTCNKSGNKLKIFKWALLAGAVIFVVFFVTRRTWKKKKAAAAAHKQRLEESASENDSTRPLKTALKAQLPQPTPPSPRQHHQTLRDIPRNSAYAPNPAQTHAPPPIVWDFPQKINPSGCLPQSFTEAYVPMPPTHHPAPPRQTPAAAGIIIQQPSHPLPHPSPAPAAATAAAATVTAQTVKPPPVQTPRLGVPGPVSLQQLRQTLAQPTTYTKPSGPAFDAPTQTRESQAPPDPNFTMI